VAYKDIDQKGFCRGGVTWGRTQKLQKRGQGKGIQKKNFFKRLGNTICGPKAKRGGVGI